MTGGHGEYLLGREARFQRIGSNKRPDYQAIETVRGLYIILGPRILRAIDTEGRSTTKWWEENKQSMGLCQWKFPPIMSDSVNL